MTRPLLVGAVILDEAVAIGIARSVDPAQSRFDVGPQLPQRLDVAGVLGVEPGQHHEQRRRIHTAVIQLERNLPQRGHLTAAHLMQDFSGLGVGERIEVFGLIGGEPPQHAFGDTESHHSICIAVMIPSRPNVVEYQGMPA